MPQSIMNLCNRIFLREVQQEAKYIHLIQPEEGINELITIPIFELSTRKVDFEKNIPCYNDCL